MSSAAETVENASIISESTAHDGNRLWIGNIDPKITEYHLVKLLEKFGKVKQFDFLFHKSGPLEGQPRGYCFVNFSTREEAERAIQCLNGKLALSKKLVVRWAHAQVRVSVLAVGDVWKVVLKGMSARVGCCSSAGPTFILDHPLGCDYKPDVLACCLVTVCLTGNKQDQYCSLVMFIFVGENWS
ncbi:putative RNA-binding protein 18 isoform X3 [Pundamilia nyererei]|uniref:Probable RNA-binding protein 18 n=3 Tax=Pseudocrenilabrinae TaxID=318546 RepID=A0A3B4G3W6_9CICH|nr:probable RNA-binding protein 18 isoform X3 [Maylandia zebra]XP_005735388.1 PREDICTED: probable RNA-binding protein 18 isoform X3 [Pundamilia nyererei]XP_026029813.1 probable RNA-binding protein 18 isoform X3 [Astatotilapia calliptera]